MSNTPHTCADEFPGQRAAIPALTVADSNSAKLLPDYDGLNDKVHRAETRVAAATEDVERVLRKQRLAINRCQSFRQSWLIRNRRSIPVTVNQVSPKELHVDLEPARATRH